MQSRRRRKLSLSLSSDRDATVVSPSIPRGPGQALGGGRPFSDRALASRAPFDPGFVPDGGRASARFLGRQQHRAVGAWPSSQLVVRGAEARAALEGALLAQRVAQIESRLDAMHVMEQREDQHTKAEEAVLEKVRAS